MDPVKAYTSRVNGSSFGIDDIPTPFTDTVAAAFRLTRREELSDSADRAFYEENEKRADVIESLGGDRQLASEYAWNLPTTIRDHVRKKLLAGGATNDPFFRTLTARQREAIEQMIAYERDFPDQVVTDGTIKDIYKAQFTEQRVRDQHLMERGGGFANFIGSAGAIITDPFLLTTLPAGAAIGIGRTALQTIGRTAAIEGSIGVVVEIPIQAEVFRFKRELESPWSFKHSAVNVLSAGVGGAALGGTIAGGVIGYRKALAAWKVRKKAKNITITPEMEESARILEETLSMHDENPLESPVVDADGNPGPKPETPHEVALENARAQHADHRPVDVADVVAGLEPEDGINNAIRRTEDPTELVSLDPRELEVDAKTFQFKNEADASGITPALRDVETFDQRLAGVSLIWENTDGKRFIADGHQRQALGVRAIEAGQDPAEVKLNGFILKESDGITAVDARQMAAVKNMAEGSGSAIDAAKILRGVGPVGEALLPPLPPRSSLVRQARGLAALGEDEFTQVINGVIDARYGALVGAATPDSKLQQAMIQVIKRTNPVNETQARSIIDQVRTAGTVTKVTEDLFGSQSVTESLYLERAQVLDAALREARKDKAVFGRLLSEEGRISDTGANQLDRAANQTRMQEASNATQTISRLANTKGPVSEALTEAARQVKGGAKASEATADFLAATRREILARDSSRVEAGGDGPGSKKAVRDRLSPHKGAPIRLKELPSHEQAQALGAIVQKQRKRTLDQVYAKAKANQKRLATAAQRIVDELGEDIVLADPGIKKRVRSEEKMALGVRDPGTLTDVIRLGFVVRSPETAATVVARLGDVFEVLDEGLTVSAMGYVDHKALVRFDDGSVGEIQLWDPIIKTAKSSGGSDFYRSVRTITKEQEAADPALAAQVLAATEASKDLYANALAKATVEWRREAMMVLPEDMRARVQAAVEAGGNAGDPGNISKNALRDSSDPELNIAEAGARDQAPDSSGTTKPSSPPAGVSRIAAGRPSQLKNRSAIDAPVRKIVREMDTNKFPGPDATRTGTVPDIEYDAVMARGQDLIDKHGEQAIVSNEINGELQTRSLASRLEDLDNAEDVLERIRLCSFPTRQVT